MLRASECNPLPEVTPYDFLPEIKAQRPWELSCGRGPAVPPTPALPLSPTTPLIFPRPNSDLEGSRAEASPPSREREARGGRRASDSFSLHVREWCGSQVAGVTRTPTPPPVGTGVCVGPGPFYAQRAHPHPPPRTDCVGERGFLSALSPRGRVWETSAAGGTPQTGPAPGLGGPSP